MTEEVRLRLAYIDGLIDNANKLAKIASEQLKDAKSFKKEIVSQILDDIVTFTVKNMVCCKTKEEAKKVTIIAHQLGFRGLNGESYKEDNGFNEELDGNCYWFFYGSVHSIEEAKELKRNIVTAEEFIKKYSRTGEALEGYLKRIPYGTRINKTYKEL